MAKVEFLVAFTDKTWDTVTVEVPLPNDSPDHEFVEWANEHMGELGFSDGISPRDSRGTVALVAVYYVSSEDGEEDED